MDREGLGAGPIDGDQGALAILDALPDAVFVVRPVRDHDGVVVDLRCDHLNAAAVDLLGRPASEVTGRTMVEVFPSSHAADVVARCLEVLATGRPRPIHVPESDDGDGDVRTAFDVHVARVDDALVIVVRVSAGRLAEVERLREVATHDALTGLANRSLVVEELGRALAGAHRGGHGAALVMMDLDRFKDVNDTLGHAVGDRVLSIAADRMRAVVRADELLARLGGDEFVVVIRDVADVAEIERITNRLLEAFREPMHVGDAEVWCTLSIGVASNRGQGATVESILGHADTALYAAKAAGRDRVAYYDVRLQQRADRRAELEHELSAALERGEFELYFQPEVDLSTGATVAVEALLRWRRPTGEVLNAAEFLAVAEETGAIVSIGSWAIEAACDHVVGRFGATAGSSGATPAPSLRVNVSGLQLVDSHFVEAVEAALTHSGLAPDRLTIEFDESALERGGERARHNLERLRRRGVALVLDDFGPGVASLGALVSMPFSRMKIDRSIVARDDDDRLLRAVIAMAHHLGLPVVAEGVESSEQLEMLRSLGCTAAQGFYLGVPEPAVVEPGPPACPAVGTDVGSSDRGVRRAHDDA